MVTGVPWQLQEEGDRAGGRGPLPFDVQSLSFLLCDQLFGKSFGWWKVEERYQPEVSLGVGKQGDELPGGHGGQLGWLCRCEYHLSICLWDGPGDAAPEAFLLAQRPEEMSPWRSFQIPMPGPVTSVLVEKIWILTLGLGWAISSRDLGPFLWGNWPGTERPGL